jgi:hypothetical protein
MDYLSIFVGIFRTYRSGSEIGRKMAESRTSHSIGFRSEEIWDVIQICERRNIRVLSTKHDEPYGWDGRD